LLADQGAEVIKVDAPGSAERNTPATSVYNRGKKQLELDLKQADGLATAKKLIASADVVIENFRPGVMDRLGLGSEAMTALNPGLVYLSLPGFAASDTERASIRAFEGVLSAAIGLYTDLQSFRRFFNARPVYTPIALGSTYGAIHGAIAITLALYAREEHGAGEVIEVPLVGAAMSAMAIVNLIVEPQPERLGMPPFTAEESARIPEWQASVQEKGESVISEIAASMAGMGSPATATQLAGDGQYIYYLSGGHSRNTRAFLMALGLYDELLAEGMVDVPVYENFHLDNNLAYTTGWSREWNIKVQEKIASVVAQQPAEHWVDRVGDVGVPCGVHRTSKGWLHAPETDAAALTVEVDDATFGKVRQIGVQTWLAGTDKQHMQPEPVQPFNLADLVERSISTNGVSAEEGKAILAGVRVLDLSNVLAGPASARTLAEYGAEVIKIDPPSPNFGPQIACRFPIEVSPGKRSMILDLKTDAGRDIFYKLVKTADVIVHNFRPGVANRLGIDYESLTAIKPDLVYVNLTAFNGPRPGPWMERPGFDPLLQAETGIQLRYAGDGQAPILHGWASCIDYITGYSATFGATLALLRRKRIGKGDLVTTSLAQGAQLVQAPQMVGAGDIQPGIEEQGQHTVGEHALHRMYQAKDGWVFVAGLPSEQGLLRQMTAFQDAADDVWADDTQVATLLAETIVTQPVANWVNAFNAAGLGAHRVDSLDDVRNQYMHEGTTEALQASWDDGRSISWVRFTDHPVDDSGNERGKGIVELAPPAYARMKRAPIQLLYPAPKQGTHTRAILSEQGYSDEQIETWLAEGVIKEQLHEKYLPA
ncbi:MAG: CoA transferase, partial [Chloroflexota bacterium]